MATIHGQPGQVEEANKASLKAKAPKRKGADTDGGWPWFGAAMGPGVICSSAKGGIYVDDHIGASRIHFGFGLGEWPLITR